MDLYKTSKRRDRAPGDCRTIINKREGGTLYQATRVSRLFIPRHFRTIFKQPGTNRLTTAMFLWIMFAQDNPNDLSYAKQIATKRTFIRKIDPYAAYCQIHANATITSTCISIVEKLNFLLLRSPFGSTTSPSEYKTISEAGNISRKGSTQGKIVGHRESQLTTQNINPKGG